MSVNYDDMATANIPQIYYDVTFDKVEGGLPLKKYVVNGAYWQDRQQGRGLCVYGTPEKRVRAFPILARAMVVAKDSVLFIPLVLLHVIACTESHPMTEQAESCNALFISNFCTPSEPSPLTTMERSIIEGFLISRCHARRRNYFSAREQLAHLTWWTEDFRAVQGQYMSDHSVDFV